MTKEAARRRIAKWSIERSSLANARNNWKELSGKYIPTQIKIKKLAQIKING